MKKWRSFRSEPRFVSSPLTEPGRQTVLSLLLLFFPVDPLDLFACFILGSLFFLFTFVLLSFFYFEPLFILSLLLLPATLPTTGRRVIYPVIRFDSVLWPTCGFFVLVFCKGLVPGL